MFHFQHVQVERFNKTILESLKTIGADTTEDRWDQYDKIIQQGLNSTIHRTINAVPSEVLLGYRLRVDNANVEPELDDESLVDVTELRAKLDKNIKASAI